MRDCSIGEAGLEVVSVGGGDSVAVGVIGIIVAGEVISVSGWNL